MAQMDFGLPFVLDGDADEESPDMAHCKDVWPASSYTIWSADSSFSYTSDVSSVSPTTSISSSCFSVEPAGPIYGSIGSLSTISPTASSWCDGLATPPVTPQHNEKWCSSTMLDVAFKPYQNAYIHRNNFSEPMQVAEADWMSRDWHVSMPATVDSVDSVKYAESKPVRESRIPLSSASRRTDPALSQQIFTTPTCSSDCQPSTEYQINWTYPSIWMTPPTVAPKATMQSTIPSSPLPRGDLTSPLKIEMFEQTDFDLSSSPMPVSSPVRSGSLQSRARRIEQSVTKFMLPTQPLLTRRSHERNSRKPCPRRAQTSSTCRPRKIASSISCDTVIPQNTFACSFPGCIDKSTGRQKRFKRQEHRKRHEISVHGGKKKYTCWVPGCSTAFTRTDNLKIHIKNTHGKNNPAQRNRYVATLDRTSEFYDPHWEGDLTDDGYPLVADLELHPCWMPDCPRRYHLEDKLKTHLLQQHGRKSSTHDGTFNSSLEDGSDPYDPEQD